MGPKCNKQPPRQGGQGVQPPKSGQARDQGDDARMPSHSSGKQMEKGENSQKASETVSSLDRGGQKRGRQIDLLVNHFLVEFQNDPEIFYYKVTISGASGCIVSRADKREIFNKFIEDNTVAFSGRTPIYDGATHMYSPVESPKTEFSVKLGEDNDAKEYMVELEKKTSKKIRDYDGSESSQDLLQKLDLVVKEHPRSRYMVMGQGFYKEVKRKMYLPSGVAAANGFSMSLRPTDQGLALNVDMSVIAAFCKKISVLDYLMKNGILKPKQKSRLDDNQRSEVERALKRLKVTVTHRSTEQKFIVLGLTEETTREVQFEIKEGQHKTIVDYYRDSYNKEIEKTEFPCLKLSNNLKRPNYVPMEFCMICDEQRFPMDSLDFEVEKQLQRLVPPNPVIRKNQILQIMESNEGPACSSFLAGFKMTVGAEMTKVTGRILDAPELLLGKDKLVQIKGDNKRWNLTDSIVFKGKNIQKWGIICFANDPNTQKGVVNNFINAMVTRFEELGINIAKQPTNREVVENMLNDAAKLKKTLVTICKKKLDILICIMEGKHPGYKSLKLICEMEIGLATQCCLLQNVEMCGKYKGSNHPSKTNNKFEYNQASQYLANFALKVNAKVGGSNAALCQSLSSQIPAIGDSQVVYFGADVNHPSNRDEKCPSIAAVVMSINWPHSNRYVVRIQRQTHRKEIISNLGHMCKELLKEYQKINQNRLPERIIFFRDGVGDWQFDKVSNQELEPLKDPLKELGETYNPKITFILAQKRHHTRLFPKSQSNNVPSGTIVDDKIVDGRMGNFYLCSHYSTHGTSKATHYYILSNENDFSSEDLQTLIYNLCFTFAKCTNPVSLVPPIYYADLAAYRGRLYVEAQQSCPSSDRDTSSSNLASTSSNSDNISFETLLRGDKSMFFI